MEQYRDLNKLIADGGVTCKLCGQKMLRADGCTWPGVYSRGVYYRRIKYGEEEFPWPDEHFHHMNCDVEECPICGGQLIGCDCDLEYTDDLEPSIS